MDVVGRMVVNNIEGDGETVSRCRYALNTLFQVTAAVVIDDDDIDAVSMDTFIRLHFSCFGVLYDGRQWSERPKDAFDLQDLT